MKNVFWVWPQGYHMMESSITWKIIKIKRSNRRVSTCGTFPPNTSPLRNNSTFITLQVIETWGFGPNFYIIKWDNKLRHNGINLRKNATQYIPTKKQLYIQNLTSNFYLGIWTKILHYQVREISKDRTRILKTEVENINTVLISNTVNDGKILTKKHMRYIDTRVKGVHFELAIETME